MANKWEDVNLTMKGECRKLTLSPDNQKMSLDCFDNGAYDIYLLKKNSNSFEKITNCKENHQMCSSSPGWSPDGRWFAYYRVDEIRSGVHDDSFKGFYIFDSDCFNDDNCMEKQIGPIFDHGLEWSKSNELMSYADKSLRFHEFNNGVLSPTNRVVKIDVRDNAENLYNSPDGQYFAYAHKFSNTETIINMLALSTDTTQEILKGSEYDNIIGWIVLP